MKAFDQGKADLTDRKGSCYTGPAFPAPITGLHALRIHTEYERLSAQKYPTEEDRMVSISFAAGYCCAGC